MPIQIKSRRAVAPCFWCGSTTNPTSPPVLEFDRYENENGEVDVYHVWCPICEARGPIQDDADLAVLEWNRMGVMLEAGAIASRMISAILREDQSTAVALVQDYMAVMNRPEFKEDME